jgi:hypothetical protein
MLIASTLLVLTIGVTLGGLVGFLFARSSQSRLRSELEKEGEQFQIGAHTIQFVKLRAEQKPQRFEIVAEMNIDQRQKTKDKRLKTKD